MKNQKQQSDWEKEFDNLWYDLESMFDCDRDQVKSFISAQIQQARAETLKEVLEIIAEQLAEIQDWTEETVGKSTFNIMAEMEKIKQKIKARLNIKL